MAGSGEHKTLRIQKSITVYREGEEGRRSRNKTNMKTSKMN
jgi:hypothetical protein